MSRRDRHSTPSIPVKSRPASPAQSVSDGSSRTGKVSLRRRFGIDSAVLWTGTTSSWSLLRGLLQISFILYFLSPEEQGLWYTFTHLAALSLFAELGLTQIISQHVSYEYTGLTLSEGQLTGDPHHLGRLVSLVRYAVRFYVLVTTLAALLLAAVGFFYFEGQTPVVLLAWIFYSIATGLYLLANLLLAIYRGLDQVAGTQRTLLLGNLATSLFTWLALVLGAGIWALPIGTALGTTILICLVLKLNSRFWLQMLRYHLKTRVDWMRQLLGYQGKMALTIVSNYFSIYLLVPVVFQVEGPVVAGQLGLTQAVVVGLMSLAHAVLMAKTPNLNMLVANGQHRESLKLAIRYGIISSAFFLLGALLFLSAVIILQHFDLYADRFLNLPLSILLLFYSFIMSALNGASQFLLAHRNVQTSLVLVRGPLFALAIFLVLPNFGLYWLLVAFNLVWLLLCIPWTLRDVVKCLAAHSDATVEENPSHA